MNFISHNMEISHEFLWFPVSQPVVEFTELIALDILNFLFDFTSWKQHILFISLILLMPRNVSLCV